MSKIKEVVLDVLKPHEPGIIEFAKEMCELETVSSIESSVVEVDKEVETVQMTIIGDDIEYEEVKKKIRELGGSVHSVDGVIAGDRTQKDENR